MPAAPSIPATPDVATLAAAVRARIAQSLEKDAAVIAASQEAHAELLRSIVTRTMASVLRPDPAAKAVADLMGAAAAAGTSADQPSLEELTAALRGLLDQLQAIAAGNARLKGSGTREDPYVVADGPLYVQAPITIGFPGLAPTQATIKADGRTVQVGS